MSMVNSIIKFNIIYFLFIISKLKGLIAELGELPMAHFHVVSFK